MEYNNVAVKTGSWCGDQTILVPFPSHWKITVHKGVMLPDLDDSQLESMLQKPVDVLKLDSILRPYHTVAIVIDDHTRPTPAADILAPLLRILRKQGIKNQNIKILVALGTHILDKKSFIRNKLGHLFDGDIEIIFPDCRDRDQLVYVGDSKTGIPIFINHHFAKADIKIAVSGIYPHDEAGFSGGAKILIGVLGLETISRFHRKHGLLKRGSAVDTDFRIELEHFADIIKLDYSINCIINNNKKVADLYCGDFRKAFRRAVISAEKSFATSVNPNADIIVSNAYPLDTSLSVLGKSKWPFNYCKEHVYKIILTSLCGCSGERIPFSTNKNELIVQKIKKLTGATATKRYLKETMLKLQSLIDNDFKWLNKYVVSIAYIDKNYKFKPSIINGCMVQYDWNKILKEMLNKFGPDYPVDVSIYLYAPLLYPANDQQNLSEINA